MPVNLQARADLRAAIRRLMAASMTTAATTTVQPRDITLLLTLVQHHVIAAHVEVARPQLHPGQR